MVCDTCGHHDTISGGSREMNPLRSKVHSTPHCRDNCIAALESFGMGKNDIVANVNFFMSVPVAADGSMAIAHGISTPDHHVDLRADANVIAVISNCPRSTIPAMATIPPPSGWSSGCP